MIKEELRLESGQLLKILPISRDKLYFTVNIYHINDIKKSFIDVDIHKHFKMEFKDRIQKIFRQEKNYIIVEYKNELKLISFGRKIKEKIDNRYNDNFDHLDVIVEQVGIYTAYDKCNLTTNLNDNSKYNNLDVYFESNEYKNLISVYNNWYNNNQLKNNKELMDYLLENGFIDQDYTMMFRNLKLKKVQSLINRRNSIIQILDNHIGTDKYHINLVDDIEKWYIKENEKQ